MKKIVLLLWVCFCFYLPTALAETYQNRDYNFQMEIPDGWGVRELSEKNTLVAGFRTKELYAGFKMEKSVATSMAPGDTFRKATREQKLDLLKTFTEVIESKTTQEVITYSDFVELGNNLCILIRTKIPSNDKAIYVFTLFNRVDYFFVFATNDSSGKYEQQFFDMLKTLRPIIGNNGSDEWQEDIKYKRDIAERDAIASVTSTPIEVTKEPAARNKNI